MYLGYGRMSRLNQTNFLHLKRIVGDSDVYYAKPGASVFFLNQLQDERWLNIREMGRPEAYYALNNWNEAQIIKLYHLDSLVWGNDVLDGADKKGVHVFQSLLNSNLFALFGEDLVVEDPATAEFIDLTWSSQNFVD